MTQLLIVSAATLVVAALAMAITAWAARRAGRVSVVDTTWGIGLTAAAVVCAVLGDGDAVRRLLLVGLVGVWGLRLSWHMHRRNRGAGEDRRYVDMLDHTPSRLRAVWLPQGAAIWFVSLPVQVSAVTRTRWDWLVVAGVTVWLIGVVLEAVGDQQLARFRADPANRGELMTSGLWSWSRHPNYFGDACVWWGIWLVACADWPGLLSVPAPLAMTYYLVRATGARPMERHLSARPGWEDYARRTSMFVPRPPRRGV